MFIKQHCVFIFISSCSFLSSKQSLKSSFILASVVQVSLPVLLFRSVQSPTDVKEKVYKQ